MTTTIIITLIGAVFLLFLWFTHLGKPTGIKMLVDGFTDTYESTNYKTYGRLQTDYSSLEHAQAAIRILGNVHFKNYTFNWGKKGLPITFTLTTNNFPDGLEIYLKSPEDDRIFTPEYAMDLEHFCLPNRLFEFRVYFRQSSSFEITEPVYLSFSLLAEYNIQKFFFFSAYDSYKVDYKFHLGPDMGSVWLGLDPGTNACCIAGGTSTSDIFVETKKDKPKITPSIINIVKEEAPEEDITQDNIPDHLYEWGAEAEAKFRLFSRRSFHSIKKLLGFKDKQKISFQESDKFLKVDGTTLSSLLVKGVFEDFQEYVDQNPKKYKEFFEEKGKFDPKRVVVAVPNNFTAGKIQDMIECIEKAADFSEIRFISEAEATLGYYIYMHDKLSERNNKSGIKGLEDETILIFDMGGATINVTLAEVFQKKNAFNDLQYYIDIASKIGYGIGGDTIDWCLAKFFWSYAKDYPDLLKFNPFEDINMLSDEAQYQGIEVDIEGIVEKDIYLKKRKLVRKAMERLKLNIIENYYNDMPFLLTKSDIYGAFAELSEVLQSLNNELGLEIDETILVNVEIEDAINHFFRKSDNGVYPLFQHFLFKKYVYDAIEDAIGEMLEIFEIGFLDTVIYSGRSTLFPMIKETVKNRLKMVLKPNTKKNERIDPQYITLKPTELKAAVAIGACWYGVNRRGIILKNKMVNSTYGVRKMASGRKSDIDFITIIPLGTPFGDKPSVQGRKGGLNDLFTYDNQRVEFYQVMGKNAKEILIKDEKHKYSKLTHQKVNHRVDKIYMEVSENDNVYCKVETTNGEEKYAQSVVKDQDIYDANEEHYTWIVN